MTEAGFISGDTGESSIVAASIFTLVNPTAGAQTLAAGWTTTADSYIGAISFTGTDTSTGIETGDTVTSTTGESITITSTTDGATVAVACRNSGEPTLDQTEIWKYAALDPGGGASYALGGTSVTHTLDFAGGSISAMVGIHIIAAAAGGDDEIRIFFPPQLDGMGPGGVQGGNRLH
jgi:hypothetical protein